MTATRRLAAIMAMDVVGNWVSTRRGWRGRCVDIFTERVLWTI